VISYGLDDRGSILGRGRILLFATKSMLALETFQPLIQCVMWVAWPEREANH